MRISNSEKLLGYLHNISPNAECDDCVSKMSGITPRQSVYQKAKKLCSEGEVTREKRECSRCGATKLSTSIGRTNSNRVTAYRRAKSPNGELRLGLKELKSIGFRKVGLWVMAGDQLSLQLLLHAKMQPALYAFVSESEILYVGKTSRSLSKRLYHYSKPGPTQKTNIRLNKLIKEGLSENWLIEIWAFGDAEEHKLGPFEFDIPAALEDDVIRKTKPVWNRRK